MFANIERWLEPGVKWKALIDILFRILTSLIFIIGGLGHFGQHQMMLDSMKESPWAQTVDMIGDPSVLLWLSGVAFSVTGTIPRTVERRCGTERDSTCGDRGLPYQLLENKHVQTLRAVR